MFYDYVPCMEELGAYRITATINSVDHLTEKGETGRFTHMENGTFEAIGVDAILVYDEENDEQIPVPADPAVDPSKPTFTGHYSASGGLNANQQNVNSTFRVSVQGVGSDGSVINAHNIFHLSENPSGAENVFEKVNCH